MACNFKYLGCKRLENARDKRTEDLGILLDSFCNLRTGFEHCPQYKINKKIERNKINIFAKS